MMIVKVLKLIKKYAAGPLVTSIVVLGVISLLPQDGSIVNAVHDVRLWVYGHWVALTIVGVALLLFASTRGTLRNILIGMNSNRPGIFLGQFGVYILLAAWISGDKHIPPRLAYYEWVGAFALACALFVLLTRITIRPYDPKTGDLSGDDALDKREDLAPDQVVILENLENLILNQQLVRAIGLYGDWGTGKTSIYRTAKKEIERKHPKIVWAEIEPWRYTSQESLVLGFYEEIGKALERSIPGVQNSAAKLLQIAEPLVRTNDKTGLFAAIFNWVQSLAQKQAADPGIYIRDILEREGRYLVVAIDNVERNTDHLQVMRTLQLVHFLRSDLVTYVFISEKGKLLAFVSEDNNEDKTKYLEKFVEYELEILPPHKSELRSFLDEKLSTSKESIPLDFKVNIPDSIVEDFETYRGVIKIYNQFILELDKRFFRDDHYVVSLDDKLALDHIRLKYPLLWRDIERRRDFYDEGNRDTDLMYRYIMKEDEQVKVRRDAINQAIEIAVPERKRDRVQELLGDLFPQSKHVLGRSVKSIPDMHKLRHDRKVAHPDVLDTYFARSQSQDNYEEGMAVVNELIKRLGEVQNELDRIILFKEFFDHINATGNKRDSIRLLTGELSYTDTEHDTYRDYLRALVRAYGQHVDFVAQDEDDGVLVNVISAVNDFAMKSANDEAVMVNDVDYIFADIWKPENMKHPSIILRMLLYMHPQRQNNFYAIDKWGDGYENIRRKGLKYVDDFYLKEPTEPQIFDPARGYEWRFVFAQWALSITTSGSMNFELRGSRARYRKANDYVIGLLNANPKMAYDVMMRDFFGKKWSSETKDAWQVDREKLLPYDTAKLISLVDRLTRATSLTTSQRSEMKELLELLKKFKPTKKDL